MRPTDAQTGQASRPSLSASDDETAGAQLFGCQTRTDAPPAVATDRVVRRRTFRGPICTGTVWLADSPLRSAFPCVSEREGNICRIASLHMHLSRIWSLLVQPLASLLTGHFRANRSSRTTGCLTNADKMCLFILRVSCGSQCRRLETEITSASDDDSWNVAEECSAVMSSTIRQPDPRPETEGEEGKRGW